MLSTYPHLVARELVALEILLVALGIVSLFYDAPLEGLADPNKTPNPAKAPWYFLGLQELLHYYPPAVAGVLVPALAIIGLCALPYLNAATEKRPLWRGHHGRLSMRAFTAGAGIILILVGPCYVLLPPTVLFLLLMFALYWPAGKGIWRMRWLIPARKPLARASLTTWAMTWFFVCAVVLTIIGTYFRGPGWSFVLPWRL